MLTGMNVGPVSGVYVWAGVNGKPVSGAVYVGGREWETCEQGCTYGRPVNRAVHSSRHKWVTRERGCTCEQA